MADARTLLNRALEAEAEARMVISAANRARYLELARLWREKAEALTRGAAQPA